MVWNFVPLDFQAAGLVFVLAVIGKFTRQETRLLTAAICVLLVSPTIGALLVVLVLSLILPIVEFVKGVST